MSISFDKLIVMVKDLNSKGESLSLTKYTRLLRSCKVVINDNIDKIDKILKRKKLLLNDYDILSLKKATRLTVFSSLQNISYAYKTASKRLLFFKDDCDMYKLKDRKNRSLFNSIKSELTLLLDKVFEQLFFASHKMIILTDKYNFTRRSCCYIDESLDKDYLQNRCDVEEKLQELYEDVYEHESSSDDNKNSTTNSSSTDGNNGNTSSNSDSTFDNAINNAINNAANSTANNVTNDVTANITTGVANNVTKEKDDKIDNDLEDISIIPSKMDMIVEKAVNDENSFEIEDF